MSFIFRATINKTQQLLSSFALLFLLVAIANGQECQPFHFQTQFTRCQITLDQCTSFGTANQGSGDPTYYQFKSCTL